MAKITQSLVGLTVTINADTLAELTETVKAVGIMQPLLVRPAAISGGASPLVRMGYEIIFGHRRYRAAIAAGLLEVPIMVRNLTDAQAARLQAIENLQREDLDPIEEAQGYSDLISNHGLTKKDMAAQLGMSRTHVYNQLKLLDLCAEGRDLVKQGLLRTELAIEVARVPIVGQRNQMDALNRLFFGKMNGATKDTPVMSYRQGREMLAAKFRGEPTAKAIEAKAGKSPRFDMAKHLQRQREWSERTFGPGPRTKGVVDHIRKELIEIEADPRDLTEWIDVVILALDGAWRAGGSPQQIIDTIAAKQTKNEGRIWPDWRTMPADKAIEHDRSHDKSTPATATT